MAEGLEALHASTDWAGVGIVLAIVGSFLLANAILFRHPRSLVEEHFAPADRPPARRLGTIRGYIYHRVNIHLGFLFLLAGFGAQLVGHLQPPSAVAPEFPTFWIGGIVLVAIALEVACWWWSHRLFRRYVRAYLVENPAEFERDAELTREVGELFGIVSAAEDTIESYASRLRTELRLPSPGVLQPARRRRSAVSRSATRPAARSEELDPVGAETDDFSI